MARKNTEDTTTQTEQVSAVGDSTTFNDQSNEGTSANPETPEHMQYADSVAAKLLKKFDARQQQEVLGHVKGVVKAFHDKKLAEINSQLEKLNAEKESVEGTANMIAGV